MAYEIFKRSIVRTEDLVLAIAPHGRIALNAACTRLFEAAHVEAVRILWDKERCGIALQATVKGQDDSYSVAFSRGRSASITVRSFFRHIDWTANKRVTLPASWDHELRVLKADLPPKFVGTKTGSSAGIGSGDGRASGKGIPRSPGASGNIRNWIALHETDTKK